MIPSDDGLQISSDDSMIILKYAALISVAFTGNEIKIDNKMRVMKINFFMEPPGDRLGRKYLIDSFSNGYGYFLHHGSRNGLAPNYQANHLPGNTRPLCDFRLADAFADKGYFDFDCIHGP